MTWQYKDAHLGPKVVLGTAILWIVGSTELLSKTGACFNIHFNSLDPVIF